MKPLHFVGSSRDDLASFPREVRIEIGFALKQAEDGERSLAAKPLSGFGGASVLEVVSDHDGDTYRAVYSVGLSEAVYVLHCFKKKSKKGISTPKRDMDLIGSRLADATADNSELKALARKEKVNGKSAAQKRGHRRGKD